MKNVYIFGLLLMIQMNILQSNCKSVNKDQNKRLDSLESQIDELGEEVVLLKEQNILQQEQINFLETLLNITGIY